MSRTGNMSIADYKKQAKPSKYRNVRVVVDGIKFASKKEAARWGELRMLQAAGQIKDLDRQVPFTLKVKGLTVGRYIADFTYVEGSEFVAEDVKGFRDRSSPVYKLFKLKAKLVKAIFDFEVREV